MASQETVALILRAKNGDRAAWDDLCTQHYPRWLDLIHGKLGADLHQAYSTADIVQSALREALRDIQALREEASFFAWVSAIARRKIAEKRRSLVRLDAAPIELVGEQGEEDPHAERMLAEEEYVRVLDDMLALFPGDPEPMAAIYLRYFGRRDILGIAETFQKSESTIHRLLRHGLELLRGRRGVR